MLLKNILNKGNPFSSRTVYYLLKSKRYIGLYSKDGVVYDNIFPAIVPETIFDTVQKRIEANKYGKHVPNVNYLLKGRIFCGCCGKPLTSYTGTSKSSVIHRYYKCRFVKKVTNCNGKTLNKEFIETTITNSLIEKLSEPNNFSLLISAIMKKQRKNLADDSDLRFLEKELSRISKALSNLLKAIEAGIFTPSTKARLQEPEAQKRDTEEKVLTERSKVKATLSENDIEKYLKHALKQEAKNLIDLLIDKVTVFPDKIYIDLKYMPNGPTNRPKKKHANSPEEKISLRGCPIISFFSQYEKQFLYRGRLKNSVWRTQKKNFLVEIYI